MSAVARICIHRSLPTSSQSPSRTTGCGSPGAAGGRAWAAASDAIARTTTPTSTSCAKRLIMNSPRDVMASLVAVFAYARPASLLCQVQDETGIHAPGYDSLNADPCQGSATTRWHGDVLRAKTFDTGRSPGIRCHTFVMV